MTKKILTGLASVAIIASVASAEVKCSEMFDYWDIFKKDVTKLTANVGSAGVQGSLEAFEILAKKMNNGGNLNISFINKNGIKKEVGVAQMALNVDYFLRDYYKKRLEKEDISVKLTMDYLPYAIIVYNAILNFYPQNYQKAVKLYSNKLSLDQIYVIISTGSLTKQKFKKYLKTLEVTNKYHIFNFTIFLQGYFLMQKKPYLFPDTIKEFYYNVMIGNYDKAYNILKELSKYVKCY